MVSVLNFHNQTQNPEMFVLGFVTKLEHRPSLGKREKKKIWAKFQAYQDRFMVLSGNPTQFTTFTEV